MVLFIFTWYGSFRKLSKFYQVHSISECYHIHLLRWLFSSKKSYSSRSIQLTRSQNVKSHDTHDWNQHVVPIALRRERCNKLRLRLAYMYLGAISDQSYHVLKANPSSQSPSSSSSGSLAQSNRMQLDTVDGVIAYQLKAPTNTQSFLLFRTRNLVCSSVYFDDFLTDSKIESYSSLSASSTTAAAAACCVTISTYTLPLGVRGVGW